jgi:hypothetical protein
VPASGIVVPAAQKDGGLSAHASKRNLTTLEHKQIMEVWRVTNVPYRKLLERYETYTRGVERFNKTKKSSQKERKIQKLSKWQPTDRVNTEDEKEMQRSHKTAQVIAIYFT